MEAEPLKLRTAPLIFLSTHCDPFGGRLRRAGGRGPPAGRLLDGWVGREIRLDAKDSRVMVMWDVRRLLRPFGTP